ncbi:hypothetical protein EYC59_04355 [Candidatus Saccharibacteria bacterium]|nr:MAG: hypothetical protein EYC59_04355 [Candidatus Saccharibacteria bacterium]
MTSKRESVDVVVRLSKIYRRTLAEVFMLRILPMLVWMRLRQKPIIFILGTPKHRNLGDQTILIAEIDYIKTYLPHLHPVSIPLSVVLSDTSQRLSRLIRTEDVILGIGGGNMGDTYIGEELCRRKFIQEFPNNKIVIFPQTIHFNDTIAGRNELKRTKNIYSKHTDLTLIGREQLSYKKMIAEFPKNKVLLTPDIVLSTNYSFPHLRRDGALLCLRSDLESKLSKADKQKITSFCKEHFSKITHTDTMSQAKFFAFRLKKSVVRNKLREFQTAQFVITDRLHGMVFSAVTGTPCIALTNYNHKVTGTFEWIKHLPYIKFCSDISELDALLKKMDVGKTYDYDPTQYDKYWDKIRNAITSAK